MANPFTVVGEACEALVTLARATNKAAQIVEEGANLALLHTRTFSAEAEIELNKKLADLPELQTILLDKSKD